MRTKATHRGVELALESTPDQQWPKSPIVTRALIECPRIERMAHKSLRKFGVSQDYAEEVVQDVAMVMQTKVLINGLGENKGQLKSISDVYFVIFRVVDLTVRNYQKNRRTAAVPLVANFTSVQFDDESHEEMMTRIAIGNEVDGGYDAVNQKLDASNARLKLQAKIDRLGWPSEIRREIKRGPGRPSKR